MCDVDTGMMLETVCDVNTDMMLERECVMLILT